MAKAMPATLRKYQRVQKLKKSYCAGKATKTALNSAVSAYVSAAVKGGQTKAEATAKANRVVNKACGVAAVAGKRKATTRKKTTTGRVRARA